MTLTLSIYPVVAEVWHLEIRWYSPFSAKIWNFKGHFLWNYWWDFDENFYA